MLGHEKLRVYQRALDFIAWRVDLLSKTTRKVAATEHLIRASESMVVNIAHGSDTWSPEERIHYAGIANGSALECAACLDILHVRGLIRTKPAVGKGMLREVVKMLIGWKTATENRVVEEPEDYNVLEDAPYFSHETLTAYQLALELTCWLDTYGRCAAFSKDLESKLDKHATSVVLNIAEGNGRFSFQEQSNFLDIAVRALVHTAALTDIVSVNSPAAATELLTGQQLMRRLSAAIKGLKESTTKHSKHSARTLSPKTRSPHTPSPPTRSPKTLSPHTRSPKTRSPSPQQLSQPIQPI